MAEIKTQESVEKKSFGQIIKESFKELRDTFVAFFNAPRALWGINVPYLLEGLVYFGILTILGKFASENVALSDLHAGWVYGGVTGGITFAMLIFGGVSDKIGVRRSLALALTAMMFGRALVAFSGTASLGQGLGSPMFYVMCAGLFLMVTAYGLYQPAAYAGVKRYTNPKTAAIGYAVVYALMNLGAFFSGLISSNTRHLFESTFPPNGLSAVFWVYVVLTGLAVLASIFLLSKKADKEAISRIAQETNDINEANNVEKKSESDSKITAEKINNSLLTGLSVLFGLTAVIFIWFATGGKLTDPDVNFWSSSSLFVSLLVIFGITGIWEFLRNRPDHPFRDVRFVFFIFALIPVQTLFAHNWLTLPYYLDRAFVGTVVGEYFEVFSNLNPVLIFFLAPIIAALTARANVYRMMILGTLVMAAPTFLLVLGPNVGILLSYILLMTIGEAMWQPRFLQWIAEIAPEGKTGAYMGIGQMPWFLTKVLTSLYSGYFVANYIPRPDSGMALKTEQMWFFYALIAIVSPIALVIAKKWMEKGMKKAA